jgi:hypothetical protein
VHAGLRVDVRRVARRAAAADASDASDAEGKRCGQAAAADAMGEAARHASTINSRFTL